MNSLGGKKATLLGPAIQAYLKGSGLSRGINNQLVFSAWDKVTGLGNYTLRKFFKDGKLYVTVSSSVVAHQLSFQKDTIIEKINGQLAEEPLFTGADDGGDFVRELILK